MRLTFIGSIDAVIKGRLISIGQVHTTLARPLLRLTRRNVVALLARPLAVASYRWTTTTVDGSEETWGQSVDNRKMIGSVIIRRPANSVRSGFVSYLSSCQAPPGDYRRTVALPRKTAAAIVALVIRLSWR